MATRPVFVPAPSSAALVREVEVAFTWHAGFAVSQKQKSIHDLHLAAQAQGLNRLLEISTRSAVKLGTRLSAFNLKVAVPGVGEVFLECAFQGSKVFEGGGPYQDLYGVPPKNAKRDGRLRESGVLVAFQLSNERWPTEPKTAFYDWLYISAIYPHREYLTRLNNYDGFTDIEFNPSRSLNCQARSCALFVALMASGQLDKAVKGRDEFLAVMRQDAPQPRDSDGGQGHLF